MGIQKIDYTVNWWVKIMSKLKLARCIQELERIKGVRVGSFNERGNNRIGERQNVVDQNLQITQEDIAKQFGVSVKKVQRIKGVRQGKGGDRKSMDILSIDTPQITQEDIAKTKTNCRGFDTLQIINILGKTTICLFAKLLK